MKNYKPQTKVTIIVGTGFDYNNKPLDPDVKERARDELEALLARSYGGYTITSGCGGWSDADGQLVQERTLIVTVYTPLPMLHERHDEVAQKIARLFRQDSVVLEVGGAWVSFVENEEVRRG